MAWSDAARRASAEVRRRRSESRASFHAYGTPKFEEFYVRPSYRKQLASRLKDMRKRIRSGQRPTHSDLSDVSSAATAYGMRGHPLHPLRMTRTMTADYAKTTKRRFRKNYLLKKG
jgi:hypothetical protein